METKVWQVDPANPDPNAIREAAQVLKRGGLVAFPTETVYGLGALAYERAAVRRIFEAKGRPLDNPLIVHIARVDQLEEVARQVPEEAYRLMDKLWPGPLTLVLWKVERIPLEVTAGLPKVAVRMPAHKVALMLIEEAGAPIAAPSANRSGKPSPTSAEHVIGDLRGRVEGVLDAGETLYGVESTIVDVTVEPPTLLRPGALPLEVLEELLGREVQVPLFARGLGEAETAVAPGMRHRHYAPDAEMVVVEAEDYSDLSRLVPAVRAIAKQKAQEGARVCVLCTDETRSAYEDLREQGIASMSLGPRSDTFIIARNLFKSLRLVDEMGYCFVVAEGLEERGLGLAAMNRLRKAAGYKIVRA